jgi:hypothetical protein
VNDFVDPTDPAAVEAVLAKALQTIGVAALLTSLAEVPQIEVRPGRPGGLLRAPVPAAVGFGDRRLVLADKEATLEHSVGGVVLARDAVPRTAVAGTLAALVCRSVASSGAQDDVSVLLTALRDAVALS